jgi:hypothetical protein
MQGVIFAAATSDGEVKLYDARAYHQGPFTTFNVGGVDPETGMRPRVTCSKVGRRSVMPTCPDMCLLTPRIKTALFPVSRLALRRALCAV